MIKPKLIYIEWCDAESSHGWWSEEDAIAWAEDDGRWVVREAIWLIKETKEYILTATRLVPEETSGDFEETKYGYIHKIPKTWIKKRKILKP